MLFNEANREVVCNFYGNRSTFEYEFEYEYEYVAIFMDIWTVSFLLQVDMGKRIFRFERLHSM